ncbi:RHS repeat domain-containing protein [Chryseolinea sp. T2]|uniref:RHS repeat protein n=1 Tax=Chryseolinea sp. T2 TaxID=3129255 RepID=UPI00307822CC
MKVIRFTVLLALVSLYSFAQQIVERSENMLPPAPTAAELGKYGLLPIGLATGSANVTIPIHTYATRNLSLPLSLSYSSNGVKVDQVASWVGLGWSLNAGGVVTKIVRDQPDDANPEPYPAQIGASTVEGIRYLEKADPVNGFDSEQDLYAFNFMGHAGKFMYSREGEQIVMPHQNISIEHLLENSESKGYFKITTPDGVCYTFEATESTKTTSEGTGCGRTFDARRVNSWFLTKIKHPAGDSIILEYDEYLYQYPLSITQTVGRNMSISNFVCAQPEISEPCMNDYIQACQTNSSVLGKRLKKVSAVGYGSLEFVSTSDRQDIADDYRLNEVVVKDRHGAVVKKFKLGYTYSVSQNQAFFNEWTTETLKKRLFLTSVEQRDVNGALINSHLLSYEDINALPPRLSYAQDHWGYFNGAVNKYFVPVDEMRREDDKGRKIFDGIGGDREIHANSSKKGMLKTITWPTGGVTTLQYEQNNYFGSKYVYPPLIGDTIDITGSGLNILNSVTRDTMSIKYTQELYINVRALSKREDYPQDGFDPEHHIVSLTVLDLTDNPNQPTQVYSVQLTLDDQPVTKYLDVNKDRLYRIVLSATGRIVQGKLMTSYLRAGPQLVETNIETGGVRVAKTLDTDGLSGVTTSTNYLYSQLANPSVSSGVSRGLPRYFATDKQMMQVTCSTYNGGETITIYCNNGIMHSSSMSNLYPADGGNVFYKFVTVTTGATAIDGVTEHEFIVNLDQLPEQVWGTDEILSVPSSNFGWNNGLEKETRIFKNTSGGLVLIKNVLNEYKTDDRVHKEVKNLVVRRRYDPALSQDAVITCDQASIDATWEISGCRNSNHRDPIFDRPINHAWSVGLGGTRCILWDSDNYVQQIHGPCHNHNVGDVLTITYALDHLDAMQYRNVAFWFYMFRTTETNYDMNGLNPVTSVSEFYYDNPEHALLSKTRQTMSDGQIKEVSTKYIDDYNDVGNFVTLREKFIVGMPVQTLTAINGRWSQADVISYNDIGLPVQLYKFEGTPLQNVTTFDPSVIVPSSDYKVQATLAYDAIGNLKDMDSRKLPDIAYIWGYNGTKIIAKALGANSSRIFVEGFEETGTDTNAKTGEKCLASGSYTISTTSFNPSSTEDLMMTYWYWDSNKWKFSGEIPFNRNISAGTKLDEIRVYPRGTQLTTISYDTHFDNVKSMTDPNNVSHYYQYDAAGRLKNVVDEDGNVLTTYKYQYYNN